MRRVRNKRKSRRTSQGKYYAVKADPSEVLRRHVPDLAFFEEEYYDRVVAKVDARNAGYKRGANGNDSRAGVSRRKTRFPGQSLCCGVCGRRLVFDGRTADDKLRCDGSRIYRCWNSISITGRLAAERIVASVWSSVEQLPDFDEAFLAEVNREADRLDVDRGERLSKLDRELARLEQEYDKLLGFEATDRLRDKQKVLESKMDEVTAERDRLRDTPSNRIEIPSADMIRELGSTELTAHALDDPAFVDDPHRFRNAKAVAAYFGLVPSQDQSGGTNRLGRLTEEGSATVRQLLVEAAWQSIRHSPTVRAHFDRIRRDDPERRKIAPHAAVGRPRTIATAHFLVRACWAMLKRNEPWRERHDPTPVTDASPETAA